MLSDVDSPIKLFQDLHQDALALSNHGVDELRNVIDTQLAAEMISGEPRLGFNDVLEVFGRQPHPEKQAARKRMKTDALYVCSAPAAGVQGQFVGARAEVWAGVVLRTRLARARLSAQITRSERFARTQRRAEGDARTERRAAASRRSWRSRRRS